MSATKKRKATEEAEVEDDTKESKDGFLLEVCYICSCTRFDKQLGGRKKASFGDYKGHKYVQLREFWVKDGQELPTKKGITLNLAQWKLLLENADKFTAYLEGKEAKE